MEDLGNRMRSIRKQKKLTLKDVAHMTGLTESLISQIENRKANPSVATLFAVSRVLGVSIGEFFDDTGSLSSPVIRTSDRSLVHTANGITYYLLNQQVSESPFEVLWAEYEKGGGTGEPIMHDGVECGVVLSGKLEVATGPEKYVLNAGDSITLESRKPHMMTNLWDGVTTAIWINSPPTF